MSFCLEGGFQLAENRLSERYEFRTSIVVENPDVGAEYIGGYTIDVSEGGLKVMLQDEIALGRMVNMRIERADAPDIEMVVMVIWCQEEVDGWRHGFKRIQADDGVTETWKDFVGGVA